MKRRFSGSPKYIEVSSGQNHEKCYWAVLPQFAIWVEWTDLGSMDPPKPPNKGNAKTKKTLSFQSMMQISCVCLQNHHFPLRLEMSFLTLPISNSLGNSLPSYLYNQYSIIKHYLHFHPGKACRKLPTLKGIKAKRQGVFSALTMHNV